PIREGGTPAEVRVFLCGQECPHKGNWHIVAYDFWILDSAVCKAAPPAGAVIYCVPLQLVRC
ncbi:MAG: hypothetical protein M1609_13105, partial [Firmicutes bacterium]|nr:hypothetical protein [Bacillota bacterium]